MPRCGPGLPQRCCPPAAFPLPRWTAAWSAWWRSAPRRRARGSIELYVAPDSVDHGVGTLLLRNALGRLSRPVRLYTFAENLRARAFYERHGFTAIAFGDGSGNEEGQPDVLYELDAVDQ
ncbi:MAG: GNAT family N-acetyltransferase [bacterium]